MMHLVNNPEHRISCFAAADSAPNKSFHLAESALQHKYAVTLSLIARFEASGPRQTLQRGYVIATDKGKPVQSVKQVRRILICSFYDGFLRPGHQYQTGGTAMKKEQSPSALKIS